MRIYSKLLLLLILTQYSHAFENIDYKLIFGDDYNPAIMTSRELMLSPIIVMGKRQEPLKIHINAFLELVNIEAQPFLVHLEKHLKKDVYNYISTIANSEFITISELPKGIDLSVDDELAVVFNISPEHLKSISPSLNNKEAFSRQPISNNVFSSVHDIDASLTQLDGNNTKLINIDSSFRFNRAIVSGSSSYKDKKSTYLKEDWLAKYEGADKSYYYGHIKNPVFANFNAKKVEKGIAIANTDLKSNIAFDSDIRYINLDYQADVKIYIDNILHDEKSLNAGRHKLNIPIQDDLFNVRVEVKDIYGRYREYDFSSAGSGVESIPNIGAPIYFVSAGKNTNKKNQVFAGVEYGVDNLSKVQIALNHLPNEDSISAQYYRVLPKGVVKSTLTLGSSTAKDGFGLKTLSSVSLGKDTNLLITHNYQKNLDLESVANEDEHFTKFDLSHKLNKKTAVRSSMERDFTNQESYYSLSAKYKVSNDFDLTITHDKYANQEAYSGINLTYSFGNHPARISSRYRSDTNENISNARYDISNKSYLDIERIDNNRMINYHLKDDIFNSKAKINHKTNGQNEYKIETNFSIATANTAAALTKTIGDYYGFAIFETPEDFIGNLGIKIDSSKCELSSNKECILLVHPEDNKYVTYITEALPLGVTTLPNELSVMVPPRGGINHTINTKQVYFVEGSLVNAKNKTIKLIMGTIHDNSGNRVLAFADETGLFVAELYDGDYTFNIPGFAPYKFSVSKDNEKNGFIEVGALKLNKAD